MDDSDASTVVTGGAYCGCSRGDHDRFDRNECGYFRQVQPELRIWTRPMRLL